MTEETTKAKAELDRAAMRLRTIEGRENELKAQLGSTEKNVAALKAQLEQSEADAKRFKAASEECGGKCGAAKAAVDARTTLLEAAERKAAVAELEKRIEAALEEKASKVRLDQLGDMLREARKLVVPDATREAAEAAARKAEETLDAAEEADRKSRQLADLERAKASAERNKAALDDSAKAAKAKADEANAEIARINEEINKLKKPAPTPEGPR